MKKFSILLTGSLLAISACANLQTMTRLEAILYCEEQATEAAQTTTGNVTIGLNSQTGMSVGAGIGINLTPRPYGQTYEACMNELAANGQIVEG